MPLEGHWERQNTPLRRLSGRERRLLVPLVLLIAIACAALLYVAIGHGSSSADPGCIEVNVPSTMGAGQIHACGRHAARLCSSRSGPDDPSAQALLEACRSAGYD